MFRGSDEELCEFCCVVTGADVGAGDACGEFVARGNVFLGGPRSG